MKKIALGFILLLVLCLVIVFLPRIRIVKVEPKTITVPDDYPTISAAISSASDGDIIFVKKGIYIESVTVDKSLTLKGENKETTIIDGNNIGPTVLIRRDGVNVTGFKIRNVEYPPPLSDSRGRFAGIHLLHVRHCNIYENNVVKTGYGVWLYGSSDNNISGNNLSGNNYGVMVESSVNNVIAGNTASNGWGGIWLVSSSGNTLRNNNMENNARNFGISGSELSQFLNDIDLSNVINGKKVYCLINKKNLAIDPVSFPDLGSLVLVNCTGITVQNLNINNNYGGIHLVSTSNSIITHNTVSSNTGGIWLQFTNNCVVSENDVKANTEWGVRVDSSNNVSVVRNDMTYNQLHGIMFVGSNNNMIVENNITNGVDRSAVNYGIYLESSNNNRIISNLILDNEYCTGIELEYSSNNLVQSNKISPGAPGINIWRESKYNRIIGNTLITDRGSTGVHLTSSSNMLIGNNITNFWTGLQLSNTSNNTITENNIDSREHSFEFYNSNNNMIYRNNFIGQTEVFNFGLTVGNISVNMWDNGKEGNYWSDYTGQDMDGDGIGDTPYQIDNNNLDNYPLMEPVIISLIIIPEFSTWT